MRRMLVSAMLWVAMGCLASRPEPVAGQPDHLEMVVLLSRHGLRSPLVANAELDRYSVDPWPAWPVAPGVLTERGARQLTLLGAFDMDLLRSEGLFADQGCRGAGAVLVRTDTDQRTRASGRALAQGMFPGCTVQMESLAPGSADPLFNLTSAAVAPAEAADAVAQVRRCAEPVPVLTQRMRELATVLEGCAPGSSCAMPRMPGLRMLQAPASVRGVAIGQGLVAWQGPLPLASSFAEDMELEYLQGMPMRDVGWGRVTPSQLNQLVALHTRYIACLDDTPVLARLGASDLLAHIAATLRQAAEGRVTPGALAAPDHRLVVVVGHDSNLVGVAALLGLHWKLDGRTDDTPPASAMLFELWRSSTGAPYVRIEMQMPSLAQMRNLTPLTLRQPPAMQAVTPAACAPGPHGCAWPVFAEAAGRAIDPSLVRPSVMQLSLVGPGTAQ